MTSLISKQLLTHFFESKEIKAIHSDRQTYKLASLPINQPGTHYWHKLSVGVHGFLHVLLEVYISGYSQNFVHLALSDKNSNPFEAQYNSLFALEMRLFSVGIPTKSMGHSFEHEQTPFVLVQYSVQTKHC
ncbi:hypothetical protein ABPG72_007089 [Tetrahymena utriculariae]